MQEEVGLEVYMETLFEAGFDIQTVLEKGYQYSLCSNPAMHRAAQQVLDVARYLHIDRDIAYRESQFKPSALARDEQRMRRL